MFKFKYRYWFHVIFWVLYILLVTVVSGSLNSFPIRFFLVHELLNLPVYVFASYSIVYFVIPKNIEKKLWPFYLAIMLVLGLASAFMCQLIEHFIYFRFVLSSIFEPKNWMSYTRLLSAFWVVSIPVVIISSRKFYMDWQESKKGKEAVEKLQLKTELQLLRLQLNPHFLFNTLNNLYALTIAKDDMAPEVVSKLSEILRFLIYDSNTQFVTLKSEIDLIENYIDLELLRYSDRLDHNFSINGNVKGLMIPPLLLFTFVENAFKHGVSNDSGKPELGIQLIAKNALVHFRVTNSKPIEAVQHEVGGIGLVNLRKRLNLLYPQKHTLTTEDGAVSYTVDLKLYMDWHEEI